MDVFEKLSQGLSELNVELKEAIISLKEKAKNLEPEKGKEKEKENKEDKPFARRGLRELTTLRSSVKEIKQSEENPEVQAVLDKIKQIFGK